MAFLRFSRDKRGYEHTYLLHTSAKKGGSARLLYWYRTPPGVKVGRPAFDDTTRTTLERQYPGVPFDWPKLMSTPMPPPDAEHWRERRRAEKAAKQARQAAERESGDTEQDEADGDEGETLETIVGPGPFILQQPAAAAVEPTGTGGAAQAAPAERPEVGSDGSSVVSPPSNDRGSRARRRRRRSGRRRDVPNRASGSDSTD